MEIVDHDFYTSFYQDLKHMTTRESQKHYLHHGRKEKRICNKKMMMGFQNKTKNQTLSQTMTKQKTKKLTKREKKEEKEEEEE